MLAEEQAREVLLSTLLFADDQATPHSRTGCPSWDDGADDRRLDAGRSIGASSRWEGRSVRSSSIRIACLQRLFPSFLFVRLVRLLRYALA